MTSQQTSQWKIINVLLIGILIPLVAASVPWLLEKFSLPHDLQYSYEGPIVTKEGFAYTVTIENHGTQTEENVEIWLPIPILYLGSYKIGTDGKTVKKTEKDPIVAIDVSIPSTQKGTEDNKSIVEISSLRPKETAKISVLVASKNASFISEHNLHKIRIVSKNTVGVVNQPDEFLGFFHKMIISLFALLFLAALAYSVYYEYFMSREKKEKYLLEQIDKLEKKNS